MSFVHKAKVDYTLCSSLHHDEMDIMMERVTKRIYNQPWVPTMYMYSCLNMSLRNVLLMQDLFIIHQVQRSKEFDVKSQKTCFNNSICIFQIWLDFCVLVIRKFKILGFNFFFFTILHQTHDFLYIKICTITFNSYLHVQYSSLKPAAGHNQRTLLNKKK